MIRKNFIYAVLIVISSLVFLGCARTIESRSEFMMQRMTVGLDLSKDQQTALNGIRLEMIQKIKAQKDARLQLKNDFVLLVKSDVMDPAKLQQMKDKMHALNLELEDFITGKLLEFHKTLTPAQKNKIADRIELMSKKMQELMN